MYLNDEQRQVSEPLIPDPSCLAKDLKQCGGLDLFERFLEERQELPRMELVWVHSAYTDGLCEWLRRRLGWRLEAPRVGGKATRIPCPGDGWWSERTFA